jgi:hypothetical protein
MLKPQNQATDSLVKVSMGSEGIVDSLVPVTPHVSWSVSSSAIVASQELVEGFFGHGRPNIRPM